MKLSITNYQLPIALVAAVIATAVGALIGFTNALIATIAIIAVAVSLYTLTNLEIGMWGIVAVIALLPFATLPIKVVLTPTFLDMALLAVLFVYAMQWMSRRRTRVTLTPAHAPIIGFIAMAVFAFVFGLRNGPLTSNLARHFAEFILSVIFTFVVIDYVDDRQRLERMALFIVVCGTMAAVIGIVLYFIPENFAERALNALRVIGYPTGNVLQYIESNPSWVNALSAHRSTRIRWADCWRWWGGSCAAVDGVTPVVCESLGVGRRLRADRRLSRPHFLTHGDAGVSGGITFDRRALSEIVVGADRRRIDHFDLACDSRVRGSIRSGRAGRRLGDPDAIWRIQGCVDLACALPVVGCRFRRCAGHRYLLGRIECLFDNCSRDGVHRVGGFFVSGDRGVWLGD